MLNTLNRRTVLIGIGMVVLFSNGLLLLNDHMIVDGWLWSFWAATGRLHMLETIYEQQGHGLGILFHLPFYTVQYADIDDTIRLYKLISFLCILIGTVALYYALIPWFGDGNAAWVAAFAAAIPMHQTAGDPGIWLYQFSYFLFSMAFLCAVGFETASVNRYVRFVLRSAALLLFFFSFHLNSILVFYFGFLVLMMRMNMDRYSAPELLNACRSRFDFLILPFLFWAHKQFFFPRHGDNVTYNQINLNPLETLSGIASSIYDGPVSILITSFTRLQYLPVLLTIAVLGVGMLIAWIFRNGQARTPDPRRLSFLETVLLAVFWMLCGILPYVVVGQGGRFDDHGWATKNTILMALPVALLLTRLTDWKNLYAKITRVILVLVFSLASLVTLALLQIESIKIRSTVNQVEAGAVTPGVIEIEDRYPVPFSEPERMILPWTYAFARNKDAIETVVFQADSSAPGRVRGCHAVALKPVAQAYSISEVEALIDCNGKLIASELAQVRTDGRQAYLQIQVKPEIASPRDALIEYYLTRLSFGDPDENPELNRFAEIDLRPRATIQ